MTSFARWVCARRACVTAEVCDKVHVNFRTGLLRAWVVLPLVVGVGCATGIAGDPAGGDPTTDSADAGAASPTGSGHPVGAGAADADSGTGSGAPDSGTARGGRDSGPPPGPSGATCADWAAPAVHAQCKDSCSTHNCAANGCYGMWWCHVPTKACKQAPPTGCN